MTETAQLLTSDGFGVSVAVNGQVIVVGAPNTMINGNNGQGAAFVFVEPAGGWVTTSEFNPQLTASDGSYQGLFGFSVGVSGETIVVGAPFHNDQTGPGEAYVFTRPKSGWALGTRRRD